MSDTPAVEVKVETPVVEAAPATVTEQASEIVDTAKALAKDLAGSEQAQNEIRYSLADLFSLLSEIRRENSEAHRSIMDRLGVIEDMIDTVEDEVDEVIDVVESAPATPVETPVAEVAQAAAVVADAAVEVAVEAPQERKAKKERRWL